MATPMITVVDDLAEGVYLASGVEVPESATFTATAHVEEGTSRGNPGHYFYSVDAKNESSTAVGHVTITFTFGATVEYAWASFAYPAGQPSGNQFVFENWFSPALEGGQMVSLKDFVFKGDAQPPLTGVTIEAV